MKILQVNKYFYLKGGSEAYFFSLIEELKNRGNDVAEFAMKNPKNKPSLWSEYFVNPIDYSTRNFRKKISYACKIIYSIEAKHKIAKILDTFKPDIVHLHIFQHQLSPSILSEIEKRKIPIVYTAHDLKSICPNYKMLTQGRICERCIGHRYYNCLIYKCIKDSYFKSLIITLEMYFHLLRKYYDLIDLFITPSNFYYQKLVETGFSKRKVVHIPNFVDEKKFVPKYDHKNYFVYFGRLTEEKGILTLVEAMKWVKNKKLVIIGEGPLKDTICRNINSLNIKNIEMLGFKEGNELSKLISNSMFSVLPSKWYENGSISLLESFAYGKPVIGANIGGIPEHITIEKDGLVFEPGNSRDLAEKINQMLVDTKKVVDMGKNARSKVEYIYSKRFHVDKISKIYNSLI